MKSVILRPAAEADIEIAYAWYGARKAGLGDDFLGAIQFAMNDVAQLPNAYAIVGFGLRRVLLRRFPYGLFYRSLDDAIYVVACLHGSRSPVHWQTRT